MNRREEEEEEKALPSHICVCHDYCCTHAADSRSFESLAVYWGYLHVSLFFIASVVTPFYKNIDESRIGNSATSRYQIRKKMFFHPIKKAKKKPTRYPTGLYYLRNFRLTFPSHFRIQITSKQ